MKLSVFSRLRGPWSRPSRAFSIRQSLLGLSLLAVLGGYALLIVTSAWLASQDRRAVHLATAASLKQALLANEPQPRSLGNLSASLTRLISPNFLAWVENDQGIPYNASRQIQLLSISTSIPLVRLNNESG